jgi:hypothetical protein
MVGRKLRFERETSRILANLALSFGSFFCLKEELYALQIIALSLTFIWGW